MTLLYSGVLTLPPIVSLSLYKLSVRSGPFSRLRCLALGTWSLHKGQHGDRYTENICNLPYSQLCRTTLKKNHVYSICAKWNQLEMELVNDIYIQLVRRWFWCRSLSRTWGRIWNSFKTYILVYPAVNTDATDGCSVVLYLMDRTVVSNMYGRHNRHDVSSYMMNEPVQYQA